MLRLRGLALAAAVALAGCGPAQPPGLLVAAASDLALAMPELVAAYEQEHGMRVSVSLGSSGQLAQQILAGAPVDLFLSADRTWVQRLEMEGRAAAGTRTVYARGLLALATAAHRSERIERLEELASPDVRRVAIANPEHAPYGRAAREALQASGAWSSLEGRLIIAENVRQALQLVRSGNVDAAIGAIALVTPELRWVAVPQELHAPLVQEGVVVAGSTHGAPAAQFLAVLAGPRGQEILQRYGFLAPPVDP